MPNEKLLSDMISPKVLDNHRGKKIKKTAPDPDGSKELTERFLAVPAKNSNSFPVKC